MNKSKDRIFKTMAGYDNWLSKYQFKNETPIETFIRVANDLSSVEKETLEEFNIFKKTVETCNIWNNFKHKLKNSWAYKFLKIMVNFDDYGVPIGLKCTPGGRITANAGTDYKNATYLNCFINSPVKNAEINYKRSNFDGSISYNVNVKTPDNSDDLNNIFLTIMEQAKTLASEGGYGINCCGKFNTPIIYKRNNNEVLGVLDDVVKGDLVFSRDNKWHPVEETMSSNKDNMVFIELENGECLHFTTDHPFLVNRNGKEVWIVAELLLEGDDLVNIL